eukprot:UN12707
MSTYLTFKKTYFMVIGKATNTILKKIEYHTNILYHVTRHLRTFGIHCG